jgi:hypothetical protein
MTIENSQNVNFYLNRQQAVELGYAARPIEFFAAGAVTAATDNLIYAIQADGGADVVISAATYKGVAYAAGYFTVNAIIKAGTVQTLICETFTVVSGKGFAFSFPQKDAA